MQAGREERSQISSEHAALAWAWKRALSARRLFFVDGGSIN